MLANSFPRLHDDQRPRETQPQGRSGGRQDSRAGCPPRQNKLLDPIQMRKRTLPRRLRTCARIHGANLVHLSRLHRLHDNHQERNRRDNDKKPLSAPGSLVTILGRLCLGTSPLYQMQITPILNDGMYHSPRLESQCQAQCPIR